MSDDHADLLSALAGAVSALTTQIAQQAEPPEHHTVDITPDTPYQPDLMTKTAVSLGIKNTGPVSVWVTIEGGRPRAGTGAIEVHAGAHLVLPTKVESIQIGVDPADVASIPTGGFTVHTYRYWTVQPAAEWGPVTAGTGGGDTSLLTATVTYSGGAYPARPSGYASVNYIGPVQPTTWLDGDTWTDNS